MNKREKWESNLAKLRTKELEIIFRYLKNKRFSKAIEIGAGNGYQSKILIDICDNLIATDMNSDRLYSAEENSKIELTVLDAEKIGSSFDKELFDFVYSSNLMEHLPDVDLCLQGCHQVLKDDGIIINILPNSNWRLLSSVLYYPVKIMRLFDYLILRLGSSSSDAQVTKNKSQGNNIKVTRGKRSFLEILIPPPHGVSTNSVSEIFAFRKKTWKRTFERNNFQVIDILNGPISSGYGLGFDRLKDILESIGFTTEYIYILKKK
jgi:2-polyprenyl-3-methyl-5-hydroxy-6-metoxy-1,4-benzoquinol methylase